MSATYATPAEVRAYVGEDVLTELPDDDAELEALIETAELDIDRVLAATTRDPSTGRKLTLGDLSAIQVTALSRATCAAVEWRTIIGEEELAEGDDGSKIARVAGGVTSIEPPPRPPGPKVREELTGFGFPWRSGTVKPEPKPTYDDC